MPPLPDPAIERHRQRLDESLAKLRRALRHWQVLSAEYEAFREELQGLPDGASREDMLAVGLDFGGTLVDENEIKAFLGDKVGKRRTLGQVIATVGHRIDYVQENVTKVEKQLEKGEAKLASLLVVAGPDLVNEDGLPIMDIREELDDDGNVVTATINGNDPAAPIQPIDIEALGQLVDIAQTQEESAPPPPTPAPAHENKPKKPSPLRSAISQDTIPAPPQKPLTNAALHACEPPPDLTLISSQSQDGGGHARIVDDAPAAAPQDWAQSVAGESAADAALRRDMLQYNMQEIGAVVAEINLDEEGEFYGYEDSDFDDEDEDEEEDDEDGYGRTTYKVITPALQREMEALQRRVAARAAAARDGGAVPEEEEEEEEGEEEEEEAAAAAEPKTRKKGVRFAKALDIAPAPPPPPPAQQPPLPPFPTPPSAANTEDAIPLLLDLLAMDELRKEELRREELRKAGVTIAGDRAQRPPSSSSSSIFKAEKKKQAAAVPAPQPQPQPQRTVPASVVAASVLERPPGLPAVAASAAPVEPPRAARRPSRFMAAKTASAGASASASAGGGVQGSIFRNMTPTINPPDADGDEEEGDGKPGKGKGKPMVSDLIKEREPAAVGAAVEAPDELDPATHRQEVATEFHRMRTRMIQQQGGFVESGGGEEEGAVVPLNEAGERRTVSRFKAARMKGGGSTI
ncbi:Prefoldin subunit-domain-containing protein [Morchella snyderi]|nr:Prefoldin subunit-domain-containing protein [Morchella snyderi]